MGHLLTKCESFDMMAKKVERRRMFMSPQFIGTLLWIPFALVVLIAGLIYGIGGYKKGLWRALGSLGA